MFEKEAREYREKGKRDGYYLVTQEMEQEALDYIIDETFKDAAEFGYNKCKEEINQKGLALQSDYENLRKEMRIYANGKKDGRLEIKKELKKTKWHKVSEQIPTEEKQYLLKFNDGTIDVLYVGIDGNLEPFILTRECFEFYKDVEKWCEIPEE